jgi:hypothetical protein
MEEEAFLGAHPGDLYFLGFDPEDVLLALAVAVCVLPMVLAASATFERLRPWYETYQLCAARPLQAK